MDRLAHLQALSNALCGSVTYQEAAGAVLARGLAALGAAAGAVALLSEDGTELVPLHAVGRPAARLPLSCDAPAAAAVRERSLVAGASTGDGATVALPLLAGGRAVGALEITLPAGRALGEPDRAFLLTLAGLGAQAVERARLGEAARAAPAGAEGLLRQRVEEVERLMDFMPIAVWKAHDPACRVITGNRASYELLRLPADANVSLSAPTGERPTNYRIRRNGVELRPDELPIQYAAAHGVEVRGAEFELVFADGTSRDLYGYATPLFDERGRVRGSLGAFIDVTDQRRAAHALAEQRRWLEGVVNLMPVPVLFVEPGTAKVTFANRAADELAGGEFPRGKPADEYHTVYHCTDARGRRLPNHDMPGVRAARGERLDGFEMDWHLPGGQRSLLIYSDTLPAMHGHPATAVLAFHDVTPLKQAEAELRTASKAKDEFLAMLAHELRNPLAPIRTAVHVLRLSGPDAPELERSRDLIERQVVHLTRLVDDLLDVSRIGRGRLELRKSVVDLAAVVNQAVETARPLLEERRHTLTVSAEPGPLRVKADPARLQQVIGNLLTNAAKYTDAGGQVWLTVEQQEGEAVVRVQDTGRGIPPDMLARVFDLFTQVDASLDRAEGGLGIGLTLVRSLVEMHGGTAEALSEGPGQGSEFVVRLPVLVEEPEPAREAPPGRPQAAAGPSRRVLVVDDNRDAADSLAILLRLTGHEVRTAYDGPAALREARAWRPEVVLLDIGLPGMSGHEVARRLREERPAEELLIVALTGYGQEEDRRRSQEAGFDLHFVKPVDPNALRDLLAFPQPLNRGVVPGANRTEGVPVRRG